jgi:hypothetical protein
MEEIFDRLREPKRLIYRTLLGRITVESNGLFC